MIESGIILVNKPRHISSFSAVNIVKRATGALKAGHFGTLDVEAEGLLVVALNSATKLFDYYLNKDKKYISTFKFGEERDTFDLEGTITRTDNKIISAEQIKKALVSFIGKQSQLPPIYSAKKVNGKKAYELAREGKEVALKAKEIEIYDFSLLEQKGVNLFTFHIACSSGTYVRALCRDLATKLSTCAECYDIIRTRCGNFDIIAANTLEEIKEGKYKFIPCEELFDLPSIILGDDDEIKILNGQQIFSFNNKSGKYKIYGKKFIGIGEIVNKKLKLTLKLS